MASASRPRSARSSTNRPAKASGDTKLGQATPTDPLGRFIARRVKAAMTSDGPNETFMRTSQKPVWDFLCDHYFRLEIDGWHRIPRDRGAGTPNSPVNGVPDGAAALLL